MGSQSIIIYDGVCNLCERSLRFVRRHDDKGVFVFVPFQSKSGEFLATRLGFDASALDSFLLVEEGRIATRSTAWIRVLRKLDGSYRMLGSLLALIPRSLRDWTYNLVGRHRYRLFGRKAVCDLDGIVDGQHVPSVEELQAMLGSNPK